MNIRTTPDNTITRASRDSIWQAVDDDTYAGPGSPIGLGATEEEAIADLLEQLEESE